MPAQPRGFVWAEADNQGRILLYKVYPGYCFKSMSELGE